MCYFTKFTNYVPVKAMLLLALQKFCSDLQEIKTKMIKHVFLPVTINQFMYQRINMGGAVYSCCDDKVKTVSNNHIVLLTQRPVFENICRDNMLAQSYVFHCFYKRALDTDMSAVDTSVGQVT